MADEDIKGFVPVTPGKGVEPIQPETDFDSQLTSKEPAPFDLNAGASSDAGVKEMSPMELSAGSPQAALQPQSPQEISQSMQQINTQIDGVVNGLKTPGLSVSDTTGQIFQYRLGRLQENLQVVNSQLNLPTTAPAVSSDQSAIEKYISYLTNGQSQLKQATQMLDSMGNSSQSLNPGDLMKVQIKVNSAQQEVQFFSALLGSSLDALKQTMNIQM
ncbi:MAG: hypothetical protein JHC93_02665 [Parachlamydiales bacterium]|nr:hypothetical protein [Parachlamydiales bacterium]